MTNCSKLPSTYSVLANSVGHICGSIERVETVQQYFLPTHVTTRIKKVQFEVRALKVILNYMDPHELEVEVQNASVRCLGVKRKSYLKFYNQGVYVISSRL